jgi:hypothetical protein
VVTHQKDGAAAVLEAQGWLLRAVGPGVQVEPRCSDSMPLHTDTLAQTGWPKRHNSNMAHAAGTTVNKE